MSDTVTPEVVTKDTRERLQGLKEKVSESLEVANERLHKVGAELHEKYDKTKDKLHGAYEKVADTSLNDVAESMGSYVKKNPGQSLLMAAGAGLLLGYLLGRRR